MYKCRDCEEIFEEPHEHETTWEKFYGVSGMFPDSHRLTIYECPRCGSDQIEEYFEEEEEEEEEEQGEERWPGYYPDDYWESKQGSLLVDEAVEKWKEERFSKEEK